MGDAFAWIGQIVEWLGQFIPRLRIIRTTHQGIKWVRGKKAVVIDPGLTVYWPLITEFLEYPTARQGVELRSQTIVTTDDKVIIVSGILVYSVPDIMTLCAETYDPDITVRDLALTAVHEVCCKLSWDELKEGQRKGTLDTKLRNAAKDALRDYGVSVLMLTLTDLAPGRVLRLVTSSLAAEYPHRLTG